MDEFRAVFRKKNSNPTRPKVDLKGRRILLAEDVAINAEIMMMVLSMQEMNVDHAPNGKIAVEMYRSHEPGYYDAVLMDIQQKLDSEPSERVKQVLPPGPKRSILFGPAL